MTASYIPCDLPFDADAFADEVEVLRATCAPTPTTRGTGPSAKRLPPPQRQELVARLRNGETVPALAREYGVTRQAVHYLRRRNGL